MVVILVLCYRATTESWTTGAYRLLALARLRTLDEVLFTTPYADRFFFCGRGMDVHELMYLVCIESCGWIQLTCDWSKRELVTGT